MTLITTLLMMLPAMIQDPLGEFRWKNRIVVIYSQTLIDAGYKEQFLLLQNQESELKERDILVFAVSDDDKIYALLFGQIELNENVAAAVKRKYFKVGQSEIILIGKDGGVKLRKKPVVKPTEIYELIDTMPMRKTEMR